MHVQAIHHAAIICSDYERSKHFYVHCLGLQVIAEHYRKERRSYKLDLQISRTGGQIEIFSFVDPPRRPSYPEACGLRHLAFGVVNIDDAILALKHDGIRVDAVRKDPYTGRRFAFFRDPDGLPLELYEQYAESQPTLNDSE
ncbi:MAG: VOC family protein [Sporolactobacillus sp.]